jgi:hypothetical protein
VQQSKYRHIPTVPYRDFGRPKKAIMEIAALVLLGSVALWIGEELNSRHG